MQNVTEQVEQRISNSIASRNVLSECYDLRKCRNVAQFESIGEQIAILNASIERDRSNLANYLRLKAEKAKAKYQAEFDEAAKADFGDHPGFAASLAAKAKAAKAKAAKAAKAKAAKAAKAKAAKAAKLPTFTRENCQAFADAILNERSWKARLRIVDETIASLPPSDSPKTWQGYLTKFRQWLLTINIKLESNVSIYEALLNTPLPFSVFIKTGNVKLPFVSFSTLPGFTCPGAGDCLEFCYSYRAWRYPAGFLRQLQNSILMQDSAGKRVISREFQALNVSRKTGKLIVRLYVDGDFASVDDFTFWIAELQLREDDCEAYGYSKSWFEILQGVNWLPPIRNYVLNVSGGSLHDEATKSRMLELPFVRNVFDAVSIDTSFLPSGFAKYDSAEYHSRTRKAYQDETGIKGFSCPGNCGNCRPQSGKHACGDLQFNIPIMIGVH